MYNNDHIEIWNLTPGKVVQTGAQDIFNIVGRLKKTESVLKLLYSLNDKPEVPVVFNASKERTGRLEHYGDFSIDTIKSTDLKNTNKILFRVVYSDESFATSEVSFGKKTFVESSPDYLLDLNGADFAEQVAQIIEGKWSVGNDESTPYLEVKQEDAGRDRIILFGNHKWKTGYEVKSRIMVRKWTTYPHNVGILFKWNPHLRGNGTVLPTQWSTGLAYFYSECPGLRMRFGVDVHLDKNGKKLGDYILKEKTCSPWRRWVGRNINRIFRIDPVYTQIKPNVIYNFHAFIHPDKYTLTVWQEGKKRPRPQITLMSPPEKLESGSVGIIAHRCAMRIYDFSVAAV